MTSSAARPLRPPDVSRAAGEGQSPVLLTRSAYPGAMSRGRHAPPAPPRSEQPLLVLALLIAAAVVAAVWIVDDTWAVQVGVTGIVVLALVGHWAASRSSTHAADQLHRESLERRRDLADTHRELAELKTQYVELLLELRAMRNESALATQDAVRVAAQVASDEAEQRALLHQLTQPRQQLLDPVYPSLHLPLVRAAFSNEIPATPIAAPRPASRGLQRESTTGFEAQPSRQLLDLTASEIARLRPAN